MKWVVKKPSRDFTALRRRTDSSSTAATAWAASTAATSSAGTVATSEPSSGWCTATPSASRAAAMSSASTAAVPTWAAGALRATGQGAGQRRAGLGLDGEGARDGGGREAGVGQREAQRVHVAEEARVDEGDALTCRDLGEQAGQVVGEEGLLHVETQRAQVGSELRAGHRRTGKDGGRQTNSLLATDMAEVRRPGPAQGRAARRQRLSDARKREFTGRLCPRRPSSARCGSAAIIIVDQGRSPQTAVRAAAPHDRADSAPRRVRRSLRRSDLQAFPQVRAHDNGVQCRVADTPYP